ncbi:hypothetical protein [Roseiconus lacunae]|uniref:hypothetical protein n=1 Tax=Roseiconus lacunae TaxID=2605694 RepID=UPI0011F3BE89|nr:hypothetical protein [Roseiconus lacunae]
MTSLAVLENAWLMCVTETVFTLPAYGDRHMANATARPTSADLLYLHTQTLELIEELHAAVKDLPLAAAVDSANFERVFCELDDLHDTIDGLAAKLRRNTAG